MSSVVSNGPGAQFRVSQMKQERRGRTDVMLVWQLVVYRADTGVLPDDVRCHLVQSCLRAMHETKIEREQGGSE
jgi:hypothetical protein